MKIRVLALVLACVVARIDDAHAGSFWIGGFGTPLNIWTEPSNWDTNTVPSSATDRGVDDVNVARMATNGTTTLIDASVNAVAFGVQVGHPATGAFGAQASTNDLVMTGGTLTTQGNFLMNIGRGRNADPNQVARFFMSGGVLNAAGITVPEGFNPDNVLGFTSVGINAEMHVSGNAIVNTDLLRLGSADANSLVVLSDHAQMNLTDDNLGFAPGVLWIEAFEETVRGTSLLDIRDCAVLTVHGEWWTDENGDGMRGQATQTELEYYIDEYITPGYIVGNGGMDPLSATFADGVITIRVAGAKGVIPEPGTALLLLPGLVALGAVRRGSRTSGRTA